MTRQIRTWHEREGAEGEPRCWDVRINGAPVPGGCIVQTDDGAFEVRYPRLATRTVPTLEEAKRRIELAPPITRPGMAVGKLLDDADENDLISPDEAGELLGLSRFRVNAMVANGVLAGTRHDGRVLVSRASVEARRARTATDGPAGRFARAFVEYWADEPDGTPVILEVDVEDAREYEEAKRFVRAVVDGEEPGRVEVLDYRRAMARCTRAKRSENGLSGPIPFKSFEAARAGARPPA